MSDTEQPSDKRERHRYTLDLPSALHIELQQIAADDGESVTDVIRTALRHYLKSREYRRKGYDVGAFKESGEEQVKLVAFI